MNNLSDIFPSPIYPSKDISNFYLEDNIFGNEFPLGGMNNIIGSISPQIQLENSQNKEKEDKDDDQALYLFRPEENQEDNFNLMNFTTPGNLENSKKLMDKNLTFFGNFKTNATSKPLLNKKKKRPTDITFKLSETNRNLTTKNNICGRKSKNSEVKGKHNKFSEDNIMRKIKTNFLEYAHVRINAAFKNKKYKFIKLYPDLNEILKKDYNIALMGRKLKDLYENSPLSSKFRKKKKENSDLNKNIIHEIYNDVENKESDVKNLLELTYLDLLKEFRTSYLDEFLKNIRKEEIKNSEILSEESKEDINRYIEKVKALCLDYENWFKKKNGRARKKKV